jgi:hypothetical protein
MLSGGFCGPEQVRSSSKNGNGPQHQSSPKLSPEIRSAFFIMSNYCKVHCKMLTECARNRPKTVRARRAKSMKISAGRGFRSFMRPSL